MTARRDFSWSLFLIAQAIYHLGVSARPSPFRWLYFLPFGGICVYLVTFTTLKNTVHDYSMGCGIFTLFFLASDHLLITDVQKELRMKNQTQPIYTKSFLERLKWTIALLNNPRGIGWNFEPSGHLPHPPSPDMSRKAFIARKLLEICQNVILLDLIGFLNRVNPCLARHGPPVSETAWIWRLALLIYALTPYLTISTLQCAYSLLSVGVGATEPREWPSIAGDLKDAYTLRNFWGYIHLFLRASVRTVDERALSDMFGIK